MPMTEHQSFARRKTIFPISLSAIDRHGRQITALQLLSRTALGALCVFPSFYGMRPLSVAMLAAAGNGLNGFFTLLGSPPNTLYLL